MIYSLHVQKTIKAFSAIILFSLFAPTYFGDTRSELRYYELEFKKEPPRVWPDTLFEKTVWHKKVSHLVLEDKKDRFFVTLLMISPYPYNYKSQNYALHYEFFEYEEAFAKFVWLDNFIKNNGVLRIKILGSMIIEEKIIYKGDSVR
ncbi:MAG: hypothetical protein ABUK01_01450 [Leptospirales bacterium]